MSISDIPNKRLNDGQQIPMLGLGVWRASDEQAETAVRDALELGYRHIDTARIYQNEVGVGQGVRASGVPREEIWLTSKVWNDDIRAGTAAEAIDGTLKRLGTDYVDLMLLHWPAEGRVAAWHALIAAREAGKVRSIGVSNFLPEQLDELVDESDVVPSLNQIEHHPLLTQEGIRAACAEHGVAVQAWSPLMQGKFEEAPALGEIAKAYERTEAQIVLRWAVQRDVIVIPKSVNKARIEENMQVFDFTLDDDHMARIDALECDGRLGPDPKSFDF